MCKHCFEMGHLYTRGNFRLKCHQKQFWRPCPFQHIPFCFDSCSVEICNPPVTERKFTVPTIKGNHCEWECSYFVYEKSFSNIQTSMFNLWALNDEPYYGTGNETVGRSYFIWIREGRNEMSLPSPWKLFLLPSTFTSSLCWEGHYWDQAAYLHILITINMYFFPFVLWCPPFILQVAKAFSCDWAQSSADRNQVYHMAFINLKKLSFETYLKTYGSYAKQSNCKFICYFNNLISYDFSCIIHMELFAGCLLSYIFHLVPWVKETNDWNLASPQRNRRCYVICRVSPSLLILLSDGTWYAFQAVI